MTFTDEDIAVITAMLSPERLANLTQLTGSPRKAIELHQNTLGLGSSLMSVTAVVEIALRNSVCENLGQYFGSRDWLLSPAAPFKWRKTEESKIDLALESARRAEYAKLNQSEKAALDQLVFSQGLPPDITHLGKARTRRSQINVTTGKIIAELTLYF